MFARFVRQDGKLLSVPLKSFGILAMHQMSEDEDVQVLMELDDTSIRFVAEDSVPHNHLVYKIVNCLGDDSTGLANMAIMFRGSEADIVSVLAVFLAVKQGTELQRIGTGIPDEDDARVFRITEWTSSVPLPLGDNLLDRLRFVILIDDHFDPGRIKFGADVVPFPEVFLQGNPKMKRKIASSTLKFKGGTLTEIENAMSALSLAGLKETTIAVLKETPDTSAKKADPPVLQIPLSLLTPSAKPRTEFWWTPTLIPFKTCARV